LVESPFYQCDTEPPATHRTLRSTVPAILESGAQANRIEGTRNTLGRMNKKDLSERDICTKFITPRRQAGRLG
jgi:hypothetical protein